MKPRVFLVPMAIVWLALVVVAWGYRAQPFRPYEPMLATEHSFRRNAEVSMESYGGLSFRFGSGDSITSSGEALIGNGVEPDEYVVQTQSDLLAGLDTIHEAALAWLRTELKP